MKMKIINEKGKLFGLINVIDLFLLLFVVCAGVFVAKPLLGQEMAAPVVVDTQDIYITYFISNIRDVSVNAINEGDQVFDINSADSFGTVMDKVVEPATIMTTDADGNVQYSIIPDRYNMYVTIHSQGQIKENEIMVNRNSMKIGYMQLVDLKNIRFQGIIFGIDY
jgi:hypothetical protein